MHRILSTLLALLAWIPVSSLAEPPVASGPSADTSAGTPAPKKPKGRTPREKETEGTEALDRFEANTIIKSQYRLDGQPLEVDPD